MTAVIALLAAGFFVRGWGVLPVALDFWADEAWWATLLNTGEYAEFGFRPFGYMWLCRALLDLGDSELALRLPSLLAGCATLVCLWKSAELTCRSRAAILFVLVVAVFHPKLIVFSKEFKPYAVEVFVFSALTMWTLLCLRRPRGRVGLTAAACMALPFCYPVVFLYPGIALALWGERLEILRRFSARQWVYLMLAVLPAAVWIHFYLYERLGAGASRQLWGAKYGVFSIDHGLLDGIAWYGAKTWALVTLPGGLDGLPAWATTLFGVGFVAGVAILIAGRRLRELALLATPLVAAAAANLLGYWPYGAFRANLFLVPGAILTTALAVDWVADRGPGRWAAYGSVAAILWVAVSAWPEAYRTKRSIDWAAAPQMTEVLAEIDDRRGEELTDWANVILADWHAWRPALFYLPRFPDLARNARLVRGPVADAAGLEAQLAAEIDRAIRQRRRTRLWLVIVRLDAHDAILSSAVVSRHAAYRRDFVTGDRDYHPVLVELRISALPDLRGASAQRYHPRPRATAAPSYTANAYALLR